MCGRYTQAADLREIVTNLGVQQVISSLLEPRYNIAPTQPIVAVSQIGQHRQLDLFSWGLQLTWNNFAPTPSNLINARIETVTQKPSFREAAKYRRCLIPASGWYEWQSTVLSAGKKQPYYFSAPSQPVLAFAGIYEIGESNQKSAAIITQPANHVVAAVHDRMPLILTPEFFDAWLDPSQTDSQLAVAVAATAKSPSLSSHPVSAAVNAASAQGPQLIEPAPPEPTQPALFQ